MANPSDTTPSDTTQGAGPDEVRHPALVCADAIETALKDVEGVDPIFAPVEVKREAMLRLTRLGDQVEAFRMKVMANAHDVAEAEAARNVGAWLAPQVKSDRSPQQAAENLACDLQAHYPLLREGLTRAAANLAQVRMIVRCLNELRRLEHVTPEILTQAEELLLAECAKLPPHELKIACDKVLEVIDPGTFEDAERQKLDDELRESRAESRLSMRRRGDGSTDLSARIPDSLAVRLKTFLESFTSPRHGASTETPREPGADGSLADGAVSSRYRDPATGERLPQDRLMGEAFCAFLERYDPARLPQHGGMATTLVITAEFDTLKRELGIGTLPDGSHLSAGDVRRLACNANLLPAVLGGPSAVLDLGTSARLFSVDQRIALGVAHPTCQASGCSVPSAWCEAHHRAMWSKGGLTDLTNGMLLCAFHHQRIHDDAYLVKHLANGDVRFARRR